MEISLLPHFILLEGNCVYSSAQLKWPQKSPLSYELPAYGPPFLFVQVLLAFRVAGCLQVFFCLFILTVPLETQVPGPLPPPPPPILFYRRLETCKKYISDWLSPQEAFVHYPSSWDLAVLVNVHIGYFFLIVWCTWRGHFWYFKYILLVILQYISSKRFTAWQDSFSVHPV